MRCATLLAALAASSFAVAQKPESPVAYFKLRTEARSLVGTQKWTEALPLLERMVMYETRDGEVWQAIGDCHYNLQQAAKAIEPYKKALELGHGALENHAYNIGCCYALSGDKENAIAWVERALAMRFENRAHLQTDEDLKILRDDPRFIKLAGLPPKKELSRDEGWRYDLDFLLGEMKRMHYTYSVRPLPEALVKDAKKLRKDIPKLTDAEIMVAMQRLLVHLDDGHSSLQPVSEKIPLLRLPIRMYAFDDGIYVIGADDANLGLIGSRVDSIGGIPAAELLERTRKYAARDNAMGIRWQGPQYMAYDALLRDLGAKANSPSFTLALTGLDGVAKSVDLTPVRLPIHAMAGKLGPSKLPNAPEPPLYLKQVNDPYWMQPLPESKALYIQFNQVTNKPKQPLADFGREIRRKLAEEPIQNVIVDVRHNNGGNSYLNREFVRTLTTFDSVRPGARIFLITGRNTFSAAQNFTNDVVRMTNAIVVGEPTSSKPFFVGESAPFRLPISGLRGTISTRLHTVDARDQRVWIAPAIPVPVTAKDYFAGRDAALEAILEVIKAG